MSIPQVSHPVFPPLTGRDHIRGAATASIFLMEYADFACPQSAQAHITIKQLQTQLGDQLCLIFRYFPHSENHCQSLKAAESAEAAAAQDKFWEMHDLLFENQANLEDWNLLEFAIELNLDTERFLKEITSHAHLTRVTCDRSSGENYGVETTPTFFIGVRHQGTQNLQTLLKTILQAIQSYE